MCILTNKFRDFWYNPELIYEYSRLDNWIHGSGDIGDFIQKGRGEGGVPIKRNKGEKTEKNCHLSQVKMHP